MILLNPGPLCSVLLLNLQPNRKYPPAEPGVYHNEIIYPVQLSKNK